MHGYHSRIEPVKLSRIFQSKKFQPTNLIYIFFSLSLSLSLIFLLFPMRSFFVFLFFAYFFLSSVSCARLTRWKYSNCTVVDLSGLATGSLSLFPDGQCRRMQPSGDLYQLSYSGNQWSLNFIQGVDCPGNPANVKTLTGTDNACTNAAALYGTGSYITISINGAAKFVQGNLFISAIAVIGALIAAKFAV